MVGVKEAIPATPRCRSCGAAIVFLRTRAGKRIPVNADTVAVGDCEFDHERHVSHFADCEQADRWRKPR